AWQDSQAQAMVFSVGLKDASAGFEGASDGYQDLRGDFSMDWHFETATSGNVAETAWLDLPEDRGSSEFDIALGFGPTVDAAYATARGSLSENTQETLNKFTTQWQSYQGRIKDLSGVSQDGGNLFRSAVASLNFLRGIQYGAAAGQWQFGGRVHSKDGSFPQNVWVNGEIYWAGLQMDETAVPVILAYRLWKAGQINPADYWDMVRRAADFIADFGPWSAQERWEETFGASPSTIAAEISALWTAAEMADAMKDFNRGARYRGTADAWSFKQGDNVDTWTYTSTG